jgi:CheY-like chemotaxis protein
MASLLVVDDDPDSRFLVRMMGERSGGALFVVAEASSGEEAIHWWQELRPDIIVLDYLMPGLSGLEVAERILAREPGQLIVLFTAHRDEKLGRRAAELGVRACLAKTDLGRLRPTLLALLEEGSEGDVTLETPEVGLTEGA